MPTVRSVLRPHLKVIPDDRGRFVCYLTPVPFTLAGAVTSDDDWATSLPTEREDVPNLGDAACLVSEGHGLLVRKGGLALQFTVLGVIDAPQTH